jgi:hemerythrin-like domain-containing protein
MENLRKEQHCDRWDDKLKELQQNLKRHVAREEDELFPRAMQLLGEVRLESLYLKMESESSGPSGRDILIYPAGQLSAT